MESTERETEVYKGNKKTEYRKLERKITAQIPSTIASSVTKTVSLELRDKFKRQGRNTAVNFKNEIVIPMSSDSSTKIIAHSGWLLCCY
jgi:hypothetical protein